MTRRPAAGRIAWSMLLAAAGAASGGCGRGDPLDMEVSAENYVAFSMWESQARDRLGPERMADFDEALQELRFRTMADGKATGGDEIDEAIRAVIDGRSVRYVLELGLGWELSQLKVEHSQLDFAMRQNAWLRIRPGDAESAEYLYDLRQRQEARLKAANDRIELIQRKLVALRLHPGNEEGAQTPSPTAPKPAAPLPMDSPAQPIGCAEIKTPATT